MFLKQITAGGADGISLADITPNCFTSIIHVRQRESLRVFRPRAVEEFSFIQAVLPQAVIQIIGFIVLIKLHFKGLRNIPMVYRLRCEVNLYVLTTRFI